jgi:hypothetical protein
VALIPPDMKGQIGFLPLLLLRNQL